jgi:hypothetical protein
MLLNLAIAGNPRPDNFHPEDESAPKIEASRLGWTAEGHIFARRIYAAWQKDEGG